MLIYGKNGKGKTRFVATAPEVLILDVNERGVRSARHSGAHVLYVSRWEDLIYAYWYLRRGEHKFKSVAIDTLTMAQQLCMDQVLKEGVDRDPNRDPKMPAMRDWGKVTESMKSMVLNFRNLPMHVLFTAQERSVENEEGHVEEVTVDMSRGNRGIALGAVEIIGRIYQRKARVAGKNRKRETTRWETRMLVGPHEIAVTKDRTGALGPVLREPTVPQIMAAAELEEE
jgi:hypothetical protein